MGAIEQSDVAGIKTERITIQGKNNLPMPADLHFPQVERALPIVIYAHGINGFKDWGGTDSIGNEFARADLAFLRFNFSHNGTKPSQPTEFTELDLYAEDNYLTRQFDLKAVLGFIENYKGPCKIDKNLIYLIGHSRGGTDALLFAADEPRIKRLVTWSAPSQPKTPWGKWDSEKMQLWAEMGVTHQRNGRTGQEMPINYSLYEEYKTHKNGKLNTEAKARNLKQPWLIVHGEDDEAVFIKDAYEMKSWQPAAEVAIIPETGHTYGRSHPFTTEGLPQATISLLLRTIDFLKA